MTPSPIDAGEGNVPCSTCRQHHKPRDPCPPVEFLREGGITRLSRLTDGRIMCCMCFGYKWREELNKTSDDVVEDVCLPCARHEGRTISG